MMATFILVKNCVVDNLIVGDTLDDMEKLFPDFIVLQNDPDIRCNIGNFYNEKDGKFYFDERFSILSGDEPIAAE